LFLNKTISTIDNIIKKSIRESLKSRGKSRTILIVVYYLSIIKGADKKKFLEKGEVKKGEVILSCLFNVDYTTKYG